MVTGAVMIDTVGSSAVNIPAATPYVGAYVSGDGEVPWSKAELADWKSNRTLRIYQGSGAYPGVAGYDAIDCETGAVSVAQCASEIEKRVQNGFVRTDVYATLGNAQAVATAVKALGQSIWNGHLFLWYADWNLDEVEAQALLGTEVAGITVMGVQWASPSSNPNTLCPGSSKTLRELNVDLSVIDPALFPLPAPAVINSQIAGVVVSGGVTLTSRTVRSSDQGKTWV